MTKAEELAAQYKSTCDRGRKCQLRGRCAEFCEDAKADFIAYGRLVQEAAAKQAWDSYDLEMFGREISDDILRMPLP